jgi:hypothetical protein
VILGLLLASTAVNVAANVIVFDGDWHQAQHGLQPWIPVLLTASGLLSAVWVCVLVLRLPADAAPKLWPGFAALGVFGLLAAAIEWVLYRQYDDTLNALMRYRIPGMPSGAYVSILHVRLPAFQADSEMVLLVGALLVAAGWFTWAVLARRDARQPAETAPEPQA